MTTTKEMIIEVQIGTETHNIGASKVRYAGEGVVTFETHPQGRYSVNEAAKRAGLKAPFAPDVDYRFDVYSPHGWWTACSVDLLNDEQAASIGIDRQKEGAPWIS